MPDHDRRLADSKSVFQRLVKCAAPRRDRLVQTIGELVRIPSENTPPVGAEPNVSATSMTADRLGLKPKCYDLRGVAGLTEHPASTDPAAITRTGPMSRRCGRAAAAGRSLLLSGHIDTVPRGSEPWQPRSFRRDRRRQSALRARLERHERRDRRLSCWRWKTSKRQGCGCGETCWWKRSSTKSSAASTARWRHACAATTPMPRSSASRASTHDLPGADGRTDVHITLRSEPAESFSKASSPCASPTSLHYVLGQVEEFARRRRARAPVHALYAGSRDPAPVWVTKISLWRLGKPGADHHACRRAGRSSTGRPCRREQQEEIEGEFFRLVG